MNTDCAHGRITPDQLRNIRGLFMDLLNRSGLKTAVSSVAPECRVAVVIPVYNETIETLTRPLLSLARQRGASRSEFEVIVVVNNSREEAEKRSPEFLANQKILAWLRAGVGPVFQSRVAIRAIDRSSAAVAEAENHVGHARNWGALVAAGRFLSGPWQERGLLAMTDADCRLSENYISEIMAIFSEHPALNGLSGSVAHEVDPALPYAETVQRAFDAHVGYCGAFSPAQGFPGGLAFQKRGGLRHAVLLSGQDIVVPLRSWLLAGGMPNRPSGEDFHFGRMVRALPGDVAATTRYRVYPLVRVSTRAGLSSYGRRVEKIVKAVTEFKSGKQRRMLIPHLWRQARFLNRLMSEAEAGALSAQATVGLMRAYGCDVTGLPLKTAAEIAGLYGAEASRPREHRDYTKLERYMIDFFYDRLPTWDASRLVA